MLVGGRGQVFGKDGTLEGPFEGAHYTAFLGISSGSYQAATPRARRHVVFVDRRYYVLLDEVAPSAPAVIELRFHSYGTVTPWPQRTGWTVNQSGSQLDIVPAGLSLVRGAVESPPGWIRPVNLLRLATPQPVATLTLATAIIPRTGAALYPEVSQEVRGNELLVHVAGDQIVFRQMPDGYVISGATIVLRP